MRGPGWSPGTARARWMSRAAATAAAGAANASTGSRRSSVSRNVAVPAGRIEGAAAGLGRGSVTSTVWRHYQPGGRCFAPPPGATFGPLNDLDDLLARWTDAEAHGDTSALDALMDPDFRGDGPWGFVLSKEEWLDRHRRRDLVYEAFGWRDVRLLVRDEVAVVSGVQAHTATYRGRDYSGRFPGTLVAVRHGGRWSIANVQLSGPE